MDGSGNPVLLPYGVGNTHVLAEILQLFVKGQFPALPYNSGGRSFRIDIRAGRLRPCNCIVHPSLPVAKFSPSEEIGTHFA